MPKEIREKLQRPNHQGVLLGDGLAACMINLAESHWDWISMIILWPKSFGLKVVG